MSRIRPTLDRYSDAPPAPDRGDRGDRGEHPRRHRTVGVLVSDLAGLIAYFVSQAQLKDATDSLAIAALFPAAWTLVRWGRTKRIDPFGLLSVAAFGLGIGISALTGGSALPLKLGKASVTGILGVACLLSAASRRPIVASIDRLLDVSGQAGTTPVDERAGRQRDRTYRIASILIGTIALLDAITQAVLANVLSTSSFVAVGSIVRWTILAIGGAMTIRYLRRSLRAKP